MHKLYRNFVFHFYILELTSWIWTHPSTWSTKIWEPSKWKSCEGFNLEHCLPCLASSMSAPTTFSPKVPMPIPKPNLALSLSLSSSSAHESPIVAKSVSKAPDQGKGCSLNLPLPIPDSSQATTNLCMYYKRNFTSQFHQIWIFGAL